MGRLLRGSVLVVLAYAGLLVLTYFQFTLAPTGFVPQQDKGYLLLNVQLPDSAAADRTQKVMAHVGRWPATPRGSRIRSASPASR